jgi:hypothetical protein
MYGMYEDFAFFSTEPTTTSLDKVLIFGDYFLLLAKNFAFNIRKVLAYVPF